MKRKLVALGMMLALIACGAAKCQSLQPQKHVRIGTYENGDGAWINGNP